MDVFGEFEELLNEGYGKTKIFYSDQSVFAAFFGLVAVFSAAKAPEVQISIHLLYGQTDRIFRLNFV